MGINSGEVLRSRGGQFNATIKPNPRVTADVPNGSIIIGSMNVLNFELTLRDKAEGCWDAKRQRNYNSSDSIHKRGYDRSSWCYIEE